MQALIVDDAPEMRLLLGSYCKQLGFEVTECEDAEKLLTSLDSLDTYDVILLDIVMPGVDGFEALARIREVNRDIPVIMTTGMDDKESVLRCLRLGASDFVSKPLEQPRLEASLRNAMRARELSSEVERLNLTLSSVPGVKDVAGRSPAMRKVFELVERVKDSDATVLLLGESGVGKEVTARSLHFKSKRAKEPFIAVNCAAIPESLLESELFGYEEGAFTGADSRKAGKFEAAGQGTIFLDEIGEMPLHAQVHLLRVLQERKVVRVGGNEEVVINARVVCATNRDLELQVREGAFREDLLYRINAYPVLVPALRERREDIPALADLFIRRFAEQEGKSITAIDPDAMQALEAYSWPGNIRQFENAIERSVLLAEGGELTLDLLPEQVQASVRGDVEVDSLPVDEEADKAVLLLEQSVEQNISEASPTARVHKRTQVVHFASATDVIPLERIEKAVLLAALHACGGDIQEAARRLDISRSTIYRRLRRYGIDPDVHRLDS